MKLKILALTALLTLGMAGPVAAETIVDLRLSGDGGPGIIIVPSGRRYRDYAPTWITTRATDTIGATVRATIHATDTVDITIHATEAIAYVTGTVDTTIHVAAISSSE